MATSKKHPTNADIYKLLGQHGEQIDAILKQVRSTNGRVTAIERWKEKIENIDEYKREHLNKTPEEVKNVWTTREKTLVAIIMALLSMVSILVGTGKL